MRVCFETFGCRLNRAEALEMEAAMSARGWIRTEEHSDADMIIVRGCSVTRNAQRECEKLIEHIKRKYPLKRLVVTGCLSDRRNEFWLRDLSLRDAPVPKRTARAYLKVQDGCNSVCSFCIVPHFRGRSQSVPFQEAVDRAKRFVDAGYREIVVTGCNLAQYSSGGKSLPDLAGALADVSGECRVRLGSIEPSPVLSETLDAMSSRGNLCRELHIPVQSGSDRILLAMKRPYRTKDVETAVSSARRAMPEIALGCDIMVGFPDERETDFVATQTLLARLDFAKVHVFPFSARPGTPAAALHGEIPPEERRRRARIVAEWSDAARSRFAGRFKGSKVRVVIEDAATLGGWTSEHLWCRTHPDKARVFTLRAGVKSRIMKRGEMIDMIVRQTEGHVLIGDPV